MELEHIFSAASYLLESDIQNINEASNQQILDVVKKSAPELTKSIDQAKANTSEVLRILKDYTRKVIGTEAKSLDDAVKLIQKNPQSEITSITNMLLKASKHSEFDLTKMPLTQKRKELTKVAEAKGVDISGKTPQEIIKELETKGPQKEHGRDAIKQEAQQEQPEPFPGKQDLFRAAYNKTVQLGWPGDPVGVNKDQSTYSKASGGKIPLKPDATVKPGTLISDFRPFKVTKYWVKQAEGLVYNKFKNNPAALRKLSKEVDTIIERNKTYKISRRVRARDFLSKFGGAFLARLGGSEADQALFNWLIKKSVGIDIFEFQKIVIDKVMSAIDVSDDRLAKMETTINSFKKMMDTDPQNPKFLISPLNSQQGWDTYDVSYTVKTNMKPVTDPKNIADPMKFFLDKMLGYVKNPKEKSWTEVPSAEDIQTELLKIAEYVKNPKKVYEYSEGEDGPLSCVQEEKSGDKLVGTQYMFPTFLGKGGLKITVRYKPEVKD